MSLAKIGSSAWENETKPKEGIERSTVKLGQCLNAVVNRLSFKASSCKLHSSTICLLEHHLVCEYGKHMEKEKAHGKGESTKYRLLFLQKGYLVCGILAVANNPAGPLAEKLHENSPNQHSLQPCQQFICKDLAYRNSSLILGIVS